jgi:hypothetical protein
VNAKVLQKMYLAPSYDTHYQSDPTTKTMVEISQTKYRIQRERCFLNSFSFCNRQQELEPKVSRQTPII